MGADDEGGTGDTSLFAIFLFSIMALALLPLTVWRISSGGGAGNDVLQPWKKVRSLRSGLHLYQVTAR
jgi:hypothetical protein